MSFNGERSDDLGEPPGKVADRESFLNFVRFLYSGKYYE
jgi:hypothetical protein